MEAELCPWLKAERLPSEKLRPLSEETALVSWMELWRVTEVLRSGGTAADVGVVITPPEVELPDLVGSAEQAEIRSKLLY